MAINNTHNGITYEIDLENDLVSLSTGGLKGSFNLSIKDFQPSTIEEAVIVINHFIDIGFIFVLKDVNGDPEDLFFPFNINVLSRQALKALKGR